MTGADEAPRFKFRLRYTDLREREAADAFDRQSPALQRAEQHGHQVIERGGFGGGVGGLDLAAQTRSLQESAYITEDRDLIAAAAAGLEAAGEVPPRPSTPAERLAMWCDRLPAPEMLRTLAAQGDRMMDATDLAAALGKKRQGGHWNSGIAVLRNNGADRSRWPALPGNRIAAARLMVCNRWPDHRELRS